MVKKVDRPKIGTATLIKDSKTGKYLFGMRIGTGVGDGKWALPGGHVENYDGTLESAAARETKEETNLDIVEIRYMMHEFYSYKEVKSPYLIIFFHAIIAEDSSKLINMEPSKCSELKWFYSNDFPFPCLDPREKLGSLLRKLNL